MGLSDQVTVHCRNIYSPLDDIRLGGELFDAAYFSDSFMLLPDQMKALKVAVSQVKPGAPIYITQTIQNTRSRFLEVVKPYLKLITTVDFGVVTYHPQIKKLIEDAGLTIVEDKPVEGTQVNLSSMTVRIFVIRDLKNSSKNNKSGSEAAAQINKPYYRK